MLTLPVAEHWLQHGPDREAFIKVAIINQIVLAITDLGPSKDSRCSLRAL